MRAGGPTTSGEVGVLLDGFWTALVGSAEDVAALPSTAPDIRRDFVPAMTFAIILFMANWGVRLCVVEPALRSMNTLHKCKVQKCAQSVVEAAFYGMFTIVGLFVVPRQQWAFNTESWWKGHYTDGHEVMRSDLRCYWIMYWSRYMQMYVSVLVEPKRKDFPEMVIHHAVTLLIMSLAYSFGWNRPGTLVMLIMDPADVPLHLAKTCKYMAEATSGWLWQFTCDRFFEIFTISFFITRLVMLLWVIWSICWEGRQHIADWGGPVGVFCVLLIVAIFLLQCYWFALIMRVAIKVWRKGNEVEDIRSDDEDEDEKKGVKDNVAKKLHDYLSWSAWFALVVAFTCLVFFDVWQSGPTWSEFKTKGEVLVSSLAITLSGESSVTDIPSARPDILLDRNVFFVFMFILLGLNWGLRLLFVEPLVRCVTGPQKKVSQAKLAQSIMEVMIYGSFFLMGVRVALAQEWVWPSTRWWMGFPDGGHEVMRADLRCFYILYMGRYAQAIVSVLLEPKRKDFYEMMTHHFVTCIIIYVSYVYGWNRVGIVVMVLLDPADVPLHLAKLCKYMAEATEREAWQFAADRLFEIFAITFFVTRLLMYGYVCWSAHFETIQYFSKGLAEWAALGLLYLLFALQVYWFILILKVAVKLLRGQGAEDIRSDDEGEDGVKEIGSKNGTSKRAGGKHLERKKEK